MLFEDVKAYIDNFILHSAPFDDAGETLQRKAVNNAEHVLKSVYPRFNDKNPLPIEVIAYQTIFMLAKDDSELRAERGTSYVGFNGVAMNLSQTYRTVAPDVIRILGRRTGSYVRYIYNTNRGIMNDSNE